MLTGRVSCYWTHAQKRYISRKNLNKLPLRWTAALIKQGFLVAWDLWKDRCNIKHSTSTAAKRRENAKLDSEIDEIRRATTNDIHGNDAKHLEMDDSRQQNMSLERKREWIAKAEAIRVAHFDIDHHPEHPTTIAAASTRLITEWVTVTAP